MLQSFKVSSTETVTISKSSERETGTVYEYLYTITGGTKVETSRIYFLVKEDYKVQAIETLLANRNIEATKIILYSCTMTTKD